MGRIMKFNELREERYVKAADAAMAAGHTKKQARLRSWPKRQKYSASGAYPASIVRRKWDSASKSSSYVDYGAGGVGNFYISIWPELDMFWDLIYDYEEHHSGGLYYHFMMGFVPADDQTAEWFFNNYDIMKSDEYNNGFFYSNYISVKLCEDGEFSPGPVVNEPFDNKLTIFKGRPAAFRFRNFLIDLISGKAPMPNFYAGMSVSDATKRAVFSIPTLKKVGAAREILERCGFSGVIETTPLKRAIRNIFKMQQSFRFSPEWGQGDAAKASEEVVREMERIGEADWRAFLEALPGNIKINSFYR